LNFVAIFIVAAAGAISHAIVCNEKRHAFRLMARSAALFVD